MKKCFKRVIALAAAAAMLAGSITFVSADTSAEVHDSAATGFSDWYVGASNSGYEGTISTDSDGNMVVTAAKEPTDSEGNTPVFIRQINNGDGIAFTDTNTVVVSATLNINDWNSDGRLYLKMNRPDSTSFDAFDEVGSNVYSLWALLEASFWSFYGTNSGSTGPNWKTNSGTYTAGKDINITTYIDGETKECTYVVTDLSATPATSTTYTGNLGFEIGDDDSLDSVSFTFRKGAVNATVKEFEVYAVEDAAVSLVTSKYSDKTDNIQVSIAGQVKDETTLPSKITLADSEGQPIAYTRYSYENGVYTIYPDDILGNGIYTVTVDKSLEFTVGALAESKVFTVKVTSKDIVVNDTFENDTDITKWSSRNGYATVTKMTEGDNSFARVNILGHAGQNDTDGVSTNPVVTRYIGGGLERAADGYTVIESKVRWGDDSDYRNYLKVNYPTEKGSLLPLKEDAARSYYDNGYGDVGQNFFSLWYRMTSAMRLYKGVGNKSGYVFDDGSETGLVRRSLDVDDYSGVAKDTWYTVRVVLDNVKGTVNTVLYDAEGNVLKTASGTDDIWYLGNYIETFDFFMRKHTSGNVASSTQSTFDFDDVKVYNTANSITIDGAEASFSFVKASGMDDATAIFAAYDSNGVLKDVKIAALEGESMAEVSETLTLDVDVTGCQTKAFIWKLGDISPVMLQE